MKHLGISFIIIYRFLRFSRIQHLHIVKKNHLRKFCSRLRRSDKTIVMIKYKNHQGMSYVRISFK